MHTTAHRTVFNSVVQLMSLCYPVTILAINDKCTLYFIQITLLAARYYAIIVTGASNQMRES